MTYGLGLLCNEGVLLAADTRSSAGVDHVKSVTKLFLFQNPGQSVMAIATAGNLATTQAVVGRLNQRLGEVGNPTNLFDAASLDIAATMVGQVLREVMDEHASYVQPYGDPTASLLLAGMIGTESPRLFLIYPAGNFIEATRDTPYLQIGELKFGKPILDRTFDCGTPMNEAMKIALLSFDATIQSNLSVGLPIDMVAFPAGDLSQHEIRRIGEEDPYFKGLRDAYATGLGDLLAGLPNADWPELSRAAVAAPPG